MADEKQTDADADAGKTADADADAGKTADAGKAADAGEKPAAKKPAAKKRAPRKPRAAAKAEVSEAKDEAAVEEAAAEEAEAEGKPESEDEAARPKTTARRGGAAAAGQSRRAAAARRAPDADTTVRAKAKYVRCAPRKARLVIDHIRGKDIAQARAILMHTPRAASRDVLKLLDSAIANAENNHDLVADDLKVGRAYVDEGPTLKRFQPRALGRATRIRKRTSHMTIELVAKD
jgi:ribosomal protein L22